MLNYKNNPELLEEYNSIVEGHIEAKKTLINLVNRSKLRHYQKWVVGEKKESLLEPGKCLLIGASGTGKTFLVETLARLTNFPLLKLDATRLTLTSAGDGIKSADVVEMIHKNANYVSKNTKGYEQSSQAIIDQTIVFIDEIDKLAWGKGTDQDWNKRTQSNFLNLFDSKDDLAGVSFIFAGAFTGLVQEETTKNMGFHNFSTHKEDVSLAEAVVKYGLIPELVGRINSIVELDKLTEDDYYTILTKTIIPKKLNDLLYFNCVELDFAPGDIEKIAHDASKSGQGVRYMKREIDKLALEAEFNYERLGNHRLLLENLIEEYSVPIDNDDKGNELP